MGRPVVTNPLLNQFQDLLETTIRQYFQAGLTVADILLTLEMVKASMVLDEVALREAHHGSNN